MRKLSIVISLATITACQSPATRLPFTPASPGSDESLLYVYRPDTFTNTLYSPELFIDAEVKTTIGTGDKYLFRLPPGEHQVELAPDEDYQGDRSLTIKTGHGQTHYLRVDTGVTLHADVPGYTPYERRFDLVRIEKDIAIEQIADCCINKGDSEADTKESASGTSRIVEEGAESNGGFSTDKTSNPFNH